jgi:hypothetical protein
MKKTRTLKQYKDIFLRRVDWNSYQVTQGRYKVDTDSLVVAMDVYTKLVLKEIKK